MFRIILPLALAGTLSVAAPATPSTSITAYRNFERAVELFREGSYPEAISLSEQLLAGTPDRPDLWYILALSYERMEKLPQAIAAGERVIELGYPRRARISYHLAQMNARAGNKDAALIWLERALEARYERRPEIKNDEAFASYGDDPRFRQVAGILPSKELTRVEGLQFDIDYLVEEARRMHADPARPAFSSRFEAAAGSLRDALA
jgi:tetratricopeptide (TPR) repeat protein